MDFELANALGRAVELKDMSTAAHTWRVTMYAQALGEACGFSTDRLLTFMQGAVLHDIGKLDIPPEILTKPDKLTSDEYEIIKTHTTLGYERMIKMGETNPIILNIVRSHHERLDGSGYPDQLTGDDIPLEARQFGIIDSFDAMTSIRPYRSDVGKEAAERAISEIRGQSGDSYDPESVELFAQLYEDGHLNSIMNHLNDPSSLANLSAPSDPEILALAQQAIERSNPSPDA